MRSAIFLSAILLGDAVVFHRTGETKTEWPSNGTMSVISWALMIFIVMDLADLVQVFRR